MMRLIVFILISAMQIMLATDDPAKRGAATQVIPRDYPQLYGAFMTASFMKDGGKTFYFVMSMYGPYNTFLMKATLVLE